MVKVEAVVLRKGQKVTIKELTLPAMAQADPFGVRGFTAPAPAVFPNTGLTRLAIPNPLQVPGQVLPTEVQGQLKLTKAWGIRGAFNHNWDPYWSTSVFGSASWVHYNGGASGPGIGVAPDLTTAKGQFCAAYALGKVVSADFVCNPDYAVYQVGVVTRWTPVKNLTFSG